MNTIIRIGARLRAARKAAGYKTSKEFLKRYKVPASTYSQHESGSRTPDNEALKFYSSVFDVSITWLSTGKGNPYKKQILSQKTLLDEELIDITHPKAITHKLNESLLVNIIKGLLDCHGYIQPKNIIKLIAEKTNRIYSTISESTSKKSEQIEMLKSELLSEKKQTAKQNN